MNDLKFIKNKYDIEGQLSDDIGMQFSLDKYTKVTFKKGLLEKSKNITPDKNGKLQS